MKKLTIFLLTLVFAGILQAQENLPYSFTYQGRAFETDGVTPLTGTATFNVQLRSADGNCLLYEENHSGVDLTTSSGFFALNVGGGTPSVSPLSMPELFNNLGGAKTIVDVACANTYSPLNAEARVIRVEVDNGGSPIQLDDQYVYPVPQALVANTLSGYDHRQFILSLSTAERNAVDSPATGMVVYNTSTEQVERYDGASWNTLLQKRLTTSCSSGEYIRGIDEDGVPDCYSDQNSAFSGISTAAGAPLSGDGTGGSPLDVVVDGTSIEVNAGTLEVGVILGSNIASNQIQIAHLNTSQCAANEIIKKSSDGSSWICASDDTGAGFSGVTTDTTIDGDGDSTPLSLADDAVTSAKIADGSIALGDLSTMTCSAGEILKLNAGGTAWECASDGGGSGSVTSVTAGDTSITIGGTATDPTVAVSEANLDLANIGGNLDLSSQVTGLLPIASIANCGADEILQQNVSGTAWTCVSAASIDTDTDTTYTAGTGIDLTGTVFSADGNLLEIANLAPTTPTDDNKVIKWDGTNFVLAVDEDNGTTYTAGDGLDLSTNTFAVDLTDIASCTNTTNDKIVWDSVNNRFTCSSDAGAASGLSSNLADTNIYIGDSGGTAQARSLSGDASITNTGVLSVSGLQGVGVDATAPTSNQVLQYDGSNWAPSTLTDNDTTYTAGTGIDLTGTAFSADGNLLEIANLAPTTPTDDNKVIKWDGTNFVLAADDTGSAFTGASTDATIDGDGDSTPLSLADDAVTSAKIADGAINDLAMIGDLTCADGQVLKWSTAGTAWTCQNDAGAGGGTENTSAVNVGTGSDVFKTQVGDELRFRSIIGGDAVTLTENADDITLSIADGDITSAKIADGSIALGDLSTMTCSAGEVLKLNAGGTAWECATDDSGSGTVTSVTAGDSTITMAGTAADPTVAVSEANLDLANIGGNLDLSSQVTGLLPIASIANCGADEILQQNVSGTAWTCVSSSALDTDTTYTAGTGIDLTGTVFSADGNLLEIANLAPTTPTDDNKVIKWDGTNFVLAADDTGSAFAGATTDTTIDGDGDSTPLSLSDDAVTSAKIADGEIALADLSTMTCSAGEVLKLNAGGTAWECASDDTGSAFAGASTDATIDGDGDSTPLSLADDAVTSAKIADGAINDLAMIGDLTCADGQVLKWSTAGTAWTCQNDAGAGGGTENTSAVNVGTGSDVFKTQVGDELRFRSIIGGDAVTLTENADDITLSIADGDITSAKIADGTIALGDLSDMTCSAGEILKLNGAGTAWECATDDSGSGTVTSVTAGNTTITMGGTATDPTVAVSEANLDLANIGGLLNLNTQTTNALPIASIANCGSDQILQQNISGTAWTCVSPSALDTDTTYSAGTGLDLTGTTFNLADTAVSAGTYGDATNVSQITIDAQGRITAATDVAITDNDTLASLSCSSGEIASWNGSSWVCAADDTGSAFSGVTTDTTIDGDGDSTPLSLADDAVTSAKIADGTIAASDLSDMSCSSGQVLKLNGLGNWVCAADDNTAFSGVTSTARISGDGDSTPLDIAQNGATSGQVLEWDGSAWSPASITDTTYTAGTGIDLTGTVFSADGNLLEIANLAPTTPTDDNKVIKWDGTNFVLAADDTGSAFTGASTDATIDGDGDSTPLSLADDAVTSAKIADGAINDLAMIGDLTCADGQVLKWSTAGTAWTCQNDAGAGGGTENTSAVNVGTGSDVFKTQVGDELRFRSIIGGDAVTLTENTDDITLSIADGDITSAKIADGSIALGDLSTMTCSAGEILKLNGAGTAWECASDDNGGGTVTSVTAGDSTITMAGTAADPTVAVSEANLDLANIGGLLNLNTQTTNVLPIASIANCGSDQILQQNISGTAWTCVSPSALDTDTTYTAGTGLDLTGTTFNLADTAVSAGTYGDATNVSQITIDAQGRITAATDVAITDNDTLASLSCSSGEIASWDGANWVCAADDTGSAFSGVTTDTTIDGDGDSTPLSLADDAVTSAKIADGTIAASDLSDMSCSSGQVLKLNGSGNWVCAADDDTAFSGVTTDTTIDGDGDSTPLSLADNAVTSAKIADGSIALGDLSTMTCSAGEVLKLNAGGTAWECASDDTGTSGTVTSVTAGDTTITMAGTAADPTVAVNEGNLDLANIGGNLDLASQVTGLLPIASIANCAADEILQQNVSGTGWTCVSASTLDSDTTYTAGTGLDLTGTTFNLADTAVSAGTYGDATNVSQITIDAQGRITAATDVAITDNDTLASLSCSSGEIASWNGSSWVCAADDTGAGFSGVSTSARISGDGDSTPLDIAQNGASSGEVLKWDGSAWSPAADVDTDTDTTYTAGTGLDLTGTVFSAEGNLLEIANLSPSSPADDNKVLAWDGTNFVLATDDTGTAFSGVTTDTTIDGDGDSTPLSLADNAVTSAKIADGEIALGDLSTMTCSAGEILKLNGAGTAWECAADEEGASGTVTSVTAGDTTITMAGTAADPTVAVNEGNLDLANIGGNLGLAQLTNCAADEILQQNVSGTGWTCVSASTLDSDTTYSAGTGLDLSGTTFNLADTAVTGGTYGDATNVAQFTVDAQGRITAASNVAITDNDTTYSAGDGLSLAGTIFSLDQQGASSGQVLKWDGSAWSPAADDTGAGFSGVTTDTTIDGDGDSTPLSIADNAVTSAKIADGSIALGDLSTMTCSAGEVLKLNAGGTAWECASDDGGTSISGGTDNVIPMFNASGDNIEDSQITDNAASGVNFANSIIQFGGSQFIHNTGTNNAFVGVGSGGSGTPGAGNTALGYNALNVLDSGISNTAVGQNALDSLNWGSNNIAIGSNSAGAITTASNNVAIGSFAMSSVTGSSNTVIGSSAGTNLGASSSSNVLIGAETGPGITQNLSNTLFIHNTQSDNPLIYGNFNDRYLRINNIFELPEIAAPTTPSSGYGRFYVKTDGKPYFKDDAGTEYDLTDTGAGFSGVTTDTTIDGDGDSTPLSIADNAVTSAKIADGTIALGDLSTMTCSAGEVLKLNAGGTAWECAADEEGASGTVTSVTAGDTTITMAGTATDPTVAVNEGNLDLANIGGSLGLAQLTNCAADQILQQNVSGSAWTCVNASSLDTDTGITQLTGDVLAGPGDGSQVASIANNAVTTTKIANGAVTSGKLGTWAVAHDKIAPLGENQFLAFHDGLGIGSPVATNIGLCGVGEFSKWNGTAFICDTPASSADNLGNHTATQNIELGNFWLSGDGGNEGIRVDSTGSVGVGTSSPEEMFHVNGANFVVEGIFNLSPTIDAGTQAAGSKMFYYPRKGAFRTGYVTGTQNSDANIGNNSVAMGSNNIASGSVSLAIGSTNTASSGSSWAIGQSNTASNTYATALGYSNTASGYGSFVGGGRGNTASGTYSSAFGYLSEASGSYSTAFGFNSTASTSYTFAVGRQATASGSYATAIGYEANAAGQHSFALGREIRTGAAATYSMAIALNDMNAATVTQANTMAIMGGDVGIGTLAPSYELEVAGTVEATAYLYSSDARYKEEVETITSALDKITRLRGVNFTWIESGKEDVGLIAQEVEEVFPKLISRDQNGYMSVQYGNLVAPLIEATKELNNKCEMTKEQLAELDARISTNERKIASIENKNEEQDTKIEKLMKIIEKQQQQIDELKQALGK